MTISEDVRIKEFFKDKITDLDDDEVDKFLGEFSCEIVLQCLSDKLKFIATSKYPDEDAWRLGRTFGDVSKRYSADTEAYSWLKNYSFSEKNALLNFLSGYWDQTKPDLDILMDLSNILKNAIVNKEWPQDLIRIGIDAVTNGYSSLEYRTEISFDIKNIFNDKLKTFEIYLSDFIVDPSSSRQTLNFVKSVLSK
jgi:hypothetical protein